jgi:hypothetical protein
MLFNNIDYYTCIRKVALEINNGIFNTFLVVMLYPDFTSNSVQISHILRTVPQHNYQHDQIAARGVPDRLQVWNWTVQKVRKVIQRNNQTSTRETVSGYIL